MAMIGSLLWTELFCWLKRKNLVIKNAGRRAACGAGVLRGADPGPACHDTGVGYPHHLRKYPLQHHPSVIYEVVATPVRHYGTSYFGALMTVFSITILWSVGINSGSMINGIIRPLWMENQTDNIAAIQAGTTPPHIITEQFF